MNRKDLRALTLMGPPRNNLELDPLTDLNLDNPRGIFLRIYIIVIYLIPKFYTHKQKFYPAVVAWSVERLLH